MERPRLPNFRRLAIFTGLFLLLSISLLFWARDIIREVVVLPISYILWMLGILIEYTPQIFFWIVLLFIIFRLANTSMSRKKKTALAPSRTAPDLAESQATTGRVSFWTTRVEFLYSGQGEYFSRLFHSALGKMLLDLLAYRYRLSRRQVEEGLREGTLDIPADVRAYALESLTPIEGIRGGLFAELWERAVSLFQVGIFKAQTAFWKMIGSTEKAEGERMEYVDPRQSKENPRVRRIMQFIEEELEVLNDDTGR